MEWGNISWTKINMINEVIKNIYPYLNYPFIEKVNSSDEFKAEEKDLITFLYFEDKINQLYNLVIELEKIHNNENFYFQQKFEIQQKLEKEKERCKKFLYLHIEKFSTLEEAVKKCQSLEFDFSYYQKGSLFDIIKTSNKMRKSLDILKEYEEKYNSLTKKENEIREKIETLLKNDLKFLQNFTFIFYKNDTFQNLLEKIKQFQTS